MTLFGHWGQTTLKKKNIYIKPQKFLPEGFLLYHVILITLQSILKVQFLEWVLSCVDSAECWTLCVSERFFCLFLFLNVMCFFHFYFFFNFIYLVFFILFYLNCKHDLSCCCMYVRNQQIWSYFQKDEGRIVMEPDFMGNWWYVVCVPIISSQKNEICGNYWNSELHKLQI